MVQINACEYPAKLPLGKAGENLAREIVFDIDRWVSVFGPGTVTLIHQRQTDTGPYPCEVAVDGSIVKWAVTATDTAKPGEGRCELSYRVGSAVVKSETWRTFVGQSLGDPGDAPPPGQGWLDQTLQAIEEVKRAVPPGGRPGEVLRKRSAADLDTEWGPGGSGSSYLIGHGLKLDDNTLSVNAVSDFTGDNTLPITAAAVQEQVGNIEVLLGTI